jgi:hypothetical protein
MSVSMFRSSRARLLALAAGAAVLAPLATAAPSYAVAPTAGVGCASSDGKIAGRGATLQTIAQFVFMSEFSSDVCGGGVVASANANGAAIGAVPSFSTANDLTDPSAPNTSGTFGGTYANNWMTAYNSANDFSASYTGSGNGQKSAGCRSAAFSGSDIPATSAQYTSLNAAAGTIGGCAPSGLVPYFDVPNGQAGAIAYPGLGDTTRTVMSIPVAISAIRMFADLPTACTSALPASQFSGGVLSLSQADVAGLYGGSYLNWGQVGGNNVAACTNTLVKRWVRADNSGTTQNHFNYLANSNGYSTATCAADQHGDPANFQSLQNLQVTHGSNADWPGGFPNGIPLGATGGTGLFVDTFGSLNPAPSIPASGSCSSISAAGKTTGCAVGQTNCAQSGNPALITGSECDNGALGYADASDAARDPGLFTVCSGLTATHTMVTLAVPPALGGTAVTESAGCSGAAATLPGGGTPNAAVGLGATWQLTAATTPNGSPSDLTWGPQGSGYPDCALTWDFVYTGQNGNAAPAPTTTGYAAAAATIPVTSVLGLPNAGTFTIAASDGTDTVHYTGLAAGTLTGVTGDTGSVSAVTALVFAKGTGGPNAQLTADQRRTLYMYFTYLMSPAAQAGLGSNTNFGSPALPYGQGYAGLPAGWLAQILKGFQNNF